MRIKFTGTNGQQIVDAMTTSLTNAGYSEMVINPHYSGTALSVSEHYIEKLWVDDNGQPCDYTAHDRYRIPLNYEIETTTGEVFNSEGQLMDYVDLVAQG